MLYVVGTPDVPKQSKDLKDKFSNLILLHTAKKSSLMKELKDQLLTLYF